MFVWLRAQPRITQMVNGESATVPAILTLPATLIEDFQPAFLPSRR